MTSGWRRAIPSHGISASRERGSGIPWFSRALFWERLVQPPGSGTNKFGAVAHFFPPLPSLLWLNRIHRPILGTNLSSESSTFYFSFDFPSTIYVFIRFILYRREMAPVFLRNYQPLIYFSFDFPSTIYVFIRFILYRREMHIEWDIEFLQYGKSVQNNHFFFLFPSDNSLYTFSFKSLYEA